MTSTFDNLESIFAILERGEKQEFKEEAEQLAEKVKGEISAKIGPITPAFIENSWCRYFGYIHPNFDHTARWHLKLVSRKTDILIDKLHERMFKGAG
jgi:hypothetical protein